MEETSYLHTHQTHESREHRTETTNGKEGCAGVTEPLKTTTGTNCWKVATAAATEKAISPTVLAAFLLLATRSDLAYQLATQHAQGDQTLLESLNLNPTEYALMKSAIERGANFCDYVAHAQAAWGGVLTVFNQFSGTSYSGTSCPTQAQIKAITQI